MSPAACAGSPPGPRSVSRGAAQLWCALSCGPGLAVAERMEHQISTALVGVQAGRVLGLEAADLAAGFYWALLKAVGCGACGAVLTPLIVGQELVPRLGGLCGVTRRACRPWHLALASRSGFAQPLLRVGVGRRVAGSGPGRRASRVVTLPAQPGTPSQPVAPSWSGAVSHHWPRRTDGRMSRP